MKLFAIKTIAALLFILTTANFSNAQNQIVKKRLNDANGNYSFLPPDNFESKQSAEGFALTNAA